jgi:hypothetical protein
MSGRDEVDWAPRVPKELIKRLYESDAANLLDEELLVDVGTRLYQRCRSILDVTMAKHGRIRCPRCDRQGRETIIDRLRDPDPLFATILCPVCAWQIIWREYARTFKRKQLNIGGAGPAFIRFVERWPLSRTNEAKMLEIDILIHAFHYSFQSLPDMPNRPAGVNLIKGHVDDVLDFLDQLSYGSGAGEERVNQKKVWEQNLNAYHQDFLGKFMHQFEEEEDTDQSLLL